MRSGLKQGAAAGVVTALVVWCVWGSLAQIPQVHDEAAYVAQAQIFASGRWTAPARPRPQFFEQAHLFVTPVFASKYPPGHSLLMVPGVLLGLAGLVPVLLAGFTGALVFLLTRRLAGPWVALLSWLVWLTARGGLDYRASYYSELTTGAVWVLGWWLLLDWDESGRPSRLGALAACVGWMAITRPFTALAFAIPVGVVVLRRAALRRAWRDVALAAGIGTALLAVIPLWSVQTIGRWDQTPLSRYQEVYFPFDRLGFGVDSTLAPERPLPPDLRQNSAELQRVHAAHTVAALPKTLAGRVGAIASRTWDGWRLALAPFAVLGLFVLCRRGWFGLASAGTLLLVYLAFGHPRNWALYYVEAQPVFAFVTALGVWHAATRLPARWFGARLAGRSGAERAAVAVLALVLVALPLSAGDVGRARVRKARQLAEQRAFESLVGRIPEERAVVFVRYGPEHNYHASLIRNGPDLERARVWRVYDRGAENAELLRQAPGRVGYLYDEEAGTLTPTNRDG